MDWIKQKKEKKNDNQIFIILSVAAANDEI